MGASILPKAVDRFIGYIRRSLAPLVVTDDPDLAQFQLHYAPVGPERATGSQALPIGLTFQFQITRAHSSDHLT